MNHDFFIIGDKLIKPETKNLFEKIEEELLSNNWESITLCSAFLTQEAANQLINIFKKISFRKKLRINILVGIKNHFTCPYAINIVLEYIKNRENKNVDYKLLLPKDRDFHLKCYLFISKQHKKVIIGSANLTGKGLSSTGELLVEINNQDFLEEIVDYIHRYCVKSGNWANYIEEYKEIYDQYKPVVFESNQKQLFKKENIKGKTNKTLKSIRLTAPTLSELTGVTKEQNELVNDIYNNVKNYNPNIIKSSWVIYRSLPEEEIDEIEKNYPIGSTFDRPVSNYKTWEIDANRMICKVGALFKVNKNSIIIFMERGSTRYKVTEEIIKTAEELGIKNQNKEETKPSKKNLDKYSNLVLKLRKN